MSVDGISDEVPTSQLQINGYALIHVTSSDDNVIDLAVTLGGNLTIPATSGTDANAQISILQIHH